MHKLNSVFKKSLSTLASQKTYFNLFIKLILITWEKLIKLSSPISTYIKKLNQTALQNPIPTIQNKIFDFSEKKKKMLRKVYLYAHRDHNSQRIDSSLTLQYPEHRTKVQTVLFNAKP